MTVNTGQRLASGLEWAPDQGMGLSCYSFTDSISGSNIQLNWRFQGVMSGAVNPPPQSSSAFCFYLSISLSLYLSISLSIYLSVFSYSHEILVKWMTQAPLITTRKNLKMPGLIDVPDLSPPECSSRLAYCVCVLCCVVCLRQCLYIMRIK